MCYKSDGLTNAFVTADEWQFGSKWPGSLAGMQVRVADAIALHLDETFSWSELVWLLHRIVVFEIDGCVGRHDDSSSLGSWDVMRHLQKG